MTHEVETMAYTNEKPWHGLGHYVEKAPTVDEMLRLAKINWKVERRSIYAADGSEIPGYASLTRDSDNAVLDVVGGRYTPIQNDEAFQFFEEFVQAGDATMETAGSLNGGRWVWGLARIGKSFKLKGKDEVGGYLLVACPHKKGKSMIAKLTTVRVVCQNTLNLSLSHNKSGEFRLHHRSGFTDDTVRQGKKVLGIARERIDEFEQIAKVLKNKSMREEDTIEVLAGIFQPQAELSDLVNNFDAKAGPRMKSLMDIHYNAPGADPDTAWGVLNTVTYYADHVASRTPDKRLTNAWFGKTAMQKGAVLKALVNA